MGEFERGVLYSDNRMDLCKMVVGPPHIEALTQSLDNNTNVRHFLLGNSIIGHRGAESIASFVVRHPNRMETWYLAGNCLDGYSFALLAKALK